VHLLFELVVLAAVWTGFGWLFWRFLPEDARRNLLKAAASKARGATLFLLVAFIWVCLVVALVARALQLVAG
jgi:hypothetical protein